MCRDPYEMPAGNGNGAQAKPAASKVRLQSLEDLDRRTSAYRKTAEPIERVEADLGGAERLSTAEQQIIRHAALTGALLEDLGTRWLAGEPLQPAFVAAVSNTSRRLYEPIGMQRQPRDVTPSLRDYLGRLDAHDAERSHPAGSCRSAALGRCAAWPVVAQLARVVDRRDG